MHGRLVSQDDRYRDLADRHGAMIERLARGYERDPVRVLDLVQSIHLELWRSLASFAGQCSEKSWVHRIAHNVGVSHLIREQRLARERLVSLDDVEPVAEERPDTTLDSEERRRLMLRFVHRLKPADRQIVLLHLEDLAAEEIADVIGMTAGTVSVRLHRAKALLRTMLGDHS